MAAPSISRSSSSTISELDASSDVEKASARSVDQKRWHTRESGDLEKQVEEQREGPRDRDFTSEAAIPELPLEVEGKDQDLQGEQGDGSVDAGEEGVLSRVFSRVLSHASTKSNWNPGPPPDGGLKAWMAGRWTSVCPGAL